MEWDDIYRKFRGKMDTEGLDGWDAAYAPMEMATLHLAAIEAAERQIDNSDLGDIADGSISDKA